MGERLKYREAVIVRAIAFAAQGGKGEAVRRAVGEVELAISVQFFVLRIDQPLAGGVEHSRIFGARRRLGLEPLDLH
jgi:hypothetical protein